MTAPRSPGSARNVPGYSLLRTLVFSACLVFPAAALPAGVLHEYPENLDADQNYLFYLHGRIIEDKGIRPTHPQYGIYEYEAILNELASRGYTVVSEVRKPGTRPVEYARRLSDRIRRYRENNVAVNSVAVNSVAGITIVGFSKGAVISLLTSSMLDDASIRYAILAGCWDAVTESDLNISGRVLSLYDVSDSVGSCQPLADKSTRLRSFEERTFDTGKSHGLFFTPDPVWLNTLFNWLETSG